MSYILDAIILVIIAITVFLSAKKGFVRTLIEVVGFVAAIIIAFTFSTPISNSIYDNAISPIVVDTVEEAATDTANASAAAVDAIWNKLPKFITNSNFLSLSKDGISKEVALETSDGVTAIADSISNSFVKPLITKLLSTLISVILVVILLFVVKILAKYINKLFSFSVIGSINKTLGAALGVVKGAVIALVLSMVITLIVSITPNGFLFFTYENINASYLFKFLAELSPFI